MCETTRYTHNLIRLPSPVTSGCSCNVCTHRGSIDPAIYSSKGVSIQRNTYVWPTYHKAVLRWGRASIALYINIMCACSDRLHERKFRWADIYPSEVVFCVVRFNVEVLQPTFFSGSDYVTGSCLCNSF